MKSHRGFAMIWAILLTAVLSIAAGAGGYYLYQQQYAGQDEQPIPQEEQVKYKSFKALAPTIGDFVFDTEIPVDWSVFADAETEEPVISMSPYAYIQVGRGGPLVEHVLVRLIKNSAKSEWDKSCAEKSEFFTASCDTRSVAGVTIYTREVAYTKADPTFGLFEMPKGVVLFDLYVDHPTVKDRYYHWSAYKKWPKTELGEGFDLTDTLDHMVQTLRFDNVTQGLF